MIISLIGGSGSGKDTQGNILSKKLKIPHVSMGQIIRSEAEKGNPTGVKAQEIAVKGIWVPGDMVAELLESYIKDASEEHGGVIINGYPRNLDQVKYFPEMLERIGEKLVCVIHLKVPDKVLLERMHRQAKHSNREDTSEEAMQQRLKSYHDTINPILDMYREEGILVEIDGTPGINEVSKAIEEGISEFTRSM